jgi:hypothetical protein
LALKLGTRLRPVILATWEIRSGGWRIQVNSGKKVPETSAAPPHLQNNQRKVGWRCGSSSRVQTPEFKLQFHQKKKKKILESYLLFVIYALEKLYKSPMTGWVEWVKW